jgi:LPXTG-site transpeptidase (sortase) family protein
MRMPANSLVLAVLILVGLAGDAGSQASREDADAYKISVNVGLPGEPGNVGISERRDTFFRPLRNMQRNDVITLTALLDDYRYRVVSVKIVSPSNISVLDPTTEEILTLVTCYPFYFVGSAPNRFIVRAERVI